jgi:ribonuclease P protein component
MREPPIVDLQETIGSEGRLTPPPRLKKRADFMRAARGAHAHATAFSLQAKFRKDEAGGPARFGFTVTKKVGGAVIRNRVRRRLKEALRLGKDLSARPGFDYVILGRAAALSLEFAALQAELARAIIDIHASSGASRSRGARAGKPRQALVRATTPPKKD